MGGTVSAKDLGEAFVAFVTDVFMTPEGCSRPEVDEELIRLEDSDQLRKAREDKRSGIDALIEQILRCNPESRSSLFLKTDSTTLALVYDRVQCGTHSMIEMAQAGFALPSKGVPPLPEFFRGLLLQNLR